MPIYIYECQNCGKTFEKFVRRRKEEEDLKCPHCNDKILKKLPAGFSFSSDSSGSSLSCSTCSGGDCSTCG